MEKDISQHNPSPKSNRTGISKYLWLIVIYAALYEIFDSYNTSFYPTIVSSIKADLGIGDSEYYLILAIGSIGLYAVIFMQYLSDIVGRKPILIVSFFGMGLSIFLLGLSHQMLSFAASLFLMYIFFSSDSWVIMVSEEAPKEKRGIFTYIVLLCGVIGVFIIPVFRSTLIDPLEPSTWSRMTWFGSLAMPIALIGLFLHETKAFQAQRKESQLKNKWNKEVLKSKLILPFSAGNALKMISFVVIGIIVGMNYASFQTVEGFLTPRLAVSFPDAEELQDIVSTIILIAGLGSLLVFAFTGILADKFGRRLIFTIYAALLTIGVIFLVISTTLQMLAGIFVFVVIAQIGFWGCFTLLKMYCVECFDTGIRGSVSGWRSFSVAIGFTVGTLLSSALALALDLGIIYIFLAILAIIFIPAMIWKFLPETKAKDLVVSEEKNN